MKSRLVIEFCGSETDYDNLKEFVRQNARSMRIAEEVIAGKEILAKDLKIDIEKRQITLRGRQILLTAREFDILVFLASHPGQVFSHRQIYEAVWKNEYFRDGGNITAHIGHIRKKMESDFECPVYIQTVHGVGYKFMEKEATLTSI